MGVGVAVWLTMRSAGALLQGAAARGLGCRGACSSGARYAGLNMAEGPVCAIGVALAPPHGSEARRWRSTRRATSCVFPSSSATFAASLSLSHRCQGASHPPAAAGPAVACCQPSATHRLTQFLPAPAGVEKESALQACSRRCLASFTSAHSPAAADPHSRSLVHPFLIRELG